MLAGLSGTIANSGSGTQVSLRIGLWLRFAEREDSQRLFVSPAC